ncbi:MAG: MBL fold metallo-hydrolase [Myxococcota bacterium]
MTIASAPTIGYLRGMEVVVLGSGSRGNAYLFRSGGTSVLVDAGVPPKALRARFHDATGDELRLDAVVLSHGHNDHAGCAEATARAFEAPLYMTRSTERALRPASDIRVKLFAPRAGFRVGALDLFPLPVPHDAPQVALVVEHDGRRAGLATDLGHVRADLVGHFSGCSTVLIESNYDPQLLACSPYPASVQDRVSSHRGHLSNGQAAGLIRQLDRGLRTVVLVHLSEQNNEPELAAACVKDALQGRRIDIRVARGSQPLRVPVSVAPHQMRLDFR